MRIASLCARCALGLGMGVLAGCGDDSTYIPSPAPPLIDDPDAAQPTTPSPDGSSEPNVPGDAGGGPVTSQPDAAGMQCASPSGPVRALQLTPIVTGLTNPLYVTAAPGDDNRLFVVEQAGIVRVVQDGQLLPAPFLDLTAEVITFAAEDGLLGLAFHPDYESNGRFFVHYSTEQVGIDPTAPDAGDGDAGLDDAGLEDASVIDNQGLFIPSGASVISEFRRSYDPNAADATSERRVLVIQQLNTNHNGGNVTFGPDGYLYLGMGDGDGRGDPNRQAQNLSTLTGKILRLDVDSSIDDQPYGIPSGNMTGAGVRPEIWSYGLRNPWRFSFDSCNGDLYLGDVGQYAMEELNYEPGNATGRNYGWNIVEGTLCYDPATACDPSGTQVPVLTYTHDQGCSITAGYVYRGGNIPSLLGTYIYSDYCTGKFSTLRMRDAVITEQADITADLNPDGVLGINSFGVDNNGEIYVVSGTGGSVYRIDPE
jgi:glucose/arabinose dehydrogenase